MLSGLTVEEIKSGENPGAQIVQALEAEEKAVRVRVDPKSVEAMHCETEDKAFTRDGWIFELKLDGYRLIASKSHGEALLLTRNGNDYTNVFPEVARAVKSLPFDDCIIDGEVVCLDAKGIPSFSRLQQRGRLSSEMEIRRAAVELPATFYAFDLIAFEDFDLRPMELLRRKELLSEVVPKLGALRYLDHIETEGEAFLEQVTAMGLEGIVAKKSASRYRGGRSGDWLKIKAERTGDFVIVGFTKPKGSRAHLGALQLADWVDGTLVYAGRVGTGFNDALLKELHGLLDPIVRKDPLCAGPVYAPGSEPLKSEQIPETSTTVWTDAVHVCEVRYREFTPDGLLRHSTFKRLRNDKSAHECERQGWSVEGSGKREAGRESTPETVSTDSASIAQASHDPPPPPAKGPVQKNIAFTNLKKIYWPTEKYTKGDLIDYYRAVSKWLLPYLANRPVVLTRFPDGIDGKSFYQKDAPVFAPEWMRTVPIWSEETQREIKYFVCDDEESLL